MNGKVERNAVPGRPAHRLQGFSGFTLIELVIIIVILGILAAVAIPKFADIGDSSRVSATRKEMLELKRALVGNPDAIVAGRLVQPGFEGDIGRLPERLEDLVSRPDSLPAYDRLARLGWNGPYIDSTAGSYLHDAWGSRYVYDPVSRRLLSVGGDDTLTISY